MLNLLFAVRLSFFPSERAAQSTCPPDHHTVRARVTTYLTHPGFAEHRQSLGLHEFPPSSARVLTDTADAATCQRLVARFGTHASQPNWRWTAYAMGDYYLISWRYVNTDGGIRIGLNPWILVDGDLREVARFAS
jgi:hypothetical protein